MQIATATFLILAQWLEPSPSAGVVGSTTVITAHDGEGMPLVGLEIQARRPDGSRGKVGVTDDKGEVSYLPSAEGQHEFLATLPGKTAARKEADEGLQLLTPYRVVGRSWRWLWALFCVPVGLLLLISNINRGRRATAS